MDTDSPRPRRGFAKQLWFWHGELDEERFDHVLEAPALADPDAAPAEDAGAGDPPRPRRTADRGARASP